MTSEIDLEPSDFFCASLPTLSTALQRFMRLSFERDFEKRYKVEF